MNRGKNKCFVCGGRCPGRVCVACRWVAPFLLTPHQRHGRNAARGYVTPPHVEARIALYRARAELGLPLFGEA